MKYPNPEEIVLIHQGPHVTTIVLSLKVQNGPVRFSESPCKGSLEYTTRDKVGRFTCLSTGFQPELPQSPKVTQLCESAPPLQSRAAPAAIQ